MKENHVCGPDSNCDAECMESAYRTNEDVSTEAVAADIACELRSHPDHWTKGELARDAEGESCVVSDPRAVCWCLEGHIARRVFGLQRDIVFNEFKTAIGTVLYFWNDQERRTVRDVVLLCDDIAGPGAGFAYFRARVLS